MLAPIRRFPYEYPINPILLILWTVITAQALEVARPFASHMVLPHDVIIPLHGRASAGSVVKVRFGAIVQTTICHPDGRWRLELPAMKANHQPMTLEISCGEDQMVLHDLLVGEVWLCSGQSNMDFPLQRAINGKEQLQRPANPMMRFHSLTGWATSAQAFQEQDRHRLREENFFQGTWQTDEPEARGAQSAVAWWFAEQRIRDTGRPVGIVENAVGGSGTEAWISPEMLQSRADYRDLLRESWIEHPKISSWARQRAKQQIGHMAHVSHPFRPGFLYQSGISWWRDFPFTAVIWYQGETNAEIPDMAWNSRLLQDLITSWRRGLGQPELPFFIIELPRIGGNDPLRQYWPEYRLAQQNAIKNTTHAYRVVSMDLGWDQPDVHPPDKKPLALRVAETVKKQGPQ
jgi:sialate O-acetylesterase